MKVVLLAGGLGTRLSEETHLRPKPMVEIGGRPILWHIMKLYSHFGIDDFVVCLGYKGYVIKEYFANFVLHASNVIVDLAANSVQYMGSEVMPPWRVTLIDTGDSTLTGGRLKRVRDYVGEGTFCMTYGDGLADVDMKALIETHRAAGREATLTAVAPPGRYGATVIEGNRVNRFEEKPDGDGGRINGGFFVLEPSVFDRIAGDAMPFEGDPLASLARDGQLTAYLHDGFWSAMDTLRDKNHLENLWDSGAAPWKLWTA